MDVLKKGVRILRNFCLAVLVLIIVLLAVCFVYNFICSRNQNDKTVSYGNGERVTIKGYLCQPVLPSSNHQRQAGYHREVRDGKYTADSQLQRVRGPSASQKYNACYHSMGLSGVILSWIKKGMKESPEEMGTILSYTIFRNKQATLHKSVFPKIVCFLIET